MIRKRADGSMELDLVGFTVMRCNVDYAFGLDLARPDAAVRGQEWASVKIEGPFEYITGGVTMHLDAEESPAQVGPALPLFKRVVDAASVAQDGTLHLRFSGEVALRVPSLPQYEAWEVLHGRGGRLICLPGGEIAIWSEITDDAGEPDRGASRS